jgi:hypothetical protein
MNCTSLFRFLFFAISAILVPGLVSAKTRVPDLSGISSVILQDTTGRKQGVKPADNNPEDNKPALKKPDIKEVPKSRRQLKPLAVKARIKIPVKRIKPVIRRPIGLIRRNLGI